MDTSSTLQANIAAVKASRAAVLKIRDGKVSDLAELAGLEIETLMVEPLPDALRCPICIGLLTEPVVAINCQHTFCQSCIQVFTPLTFLFMSRPHRRVLMYL